MLVHVAGMPAIRVLDRYAYVWVDAESKQDGKGRCVIRVRSASGVLACSFENLVVLVRPGRVAGRVAGRVWTLTTRFSHVSDQQKLDFDVSGT